MKSWKILTFCVIAALCLVVLAAPKANAATEGIYTYEVSNGKATITGCEDAGLNFEDTNVVPSTLGGYPVTAIGYEAFKYCNNMISIRLPDTLVTIGDRAFYGCAQLSGIRIPDSVTTIGDSAFSGCMGFSSVTIGNGVITIGDSAFEGCIGMRSVTIGNSVTTIGDNAFYRCKSLKSVTIPDSVTTIGEETFSNCSELESVTIGDSVTTIGYAAFFFCESLTALTIGDSVTTIGPCAFLDCWKLTSVTIPDSVTTIDYSAFENCYNLTSVNIPDGITVINESVFMSCPLTSVTIPDSVTRIGADAFWSSALTSVMIPDSVEIIDAYAFAYCEKLTSVTLGKGVTTIDHCAFYYCSSLASIVIPANVTFVESEAFSDCSALKDVYYAGTREQWKEIYTPLSPWQDVLSRATIHYNWHEGPHSFSSYIANGDATCTADGTKTAKCDICDETDTQPDPGTTLGHSFTNYVSNNDATCTADGTKTAKCDRCSERDTQPDPGSALGHNWDGGFYTAPTLTKDGYTTYTCLRCGEKLVVVDQKENEILTQPVSVNTDSGNTVHFTVQTGGVVESYQWQYRKIWKWFDTTMEGFDTDTLTVPATGARNGYDYRCVITFVGGMVLITEPAELTVNTCLTITDHPNDQTVVLGYKGQFTAAATGEGLKYQWQYQRPGGERWIDTNMEGANRPTVYIETTAARDGYKYRCRITDITGNEAFTQPAAMRVLSFTSHPEEVFAGTGATVTFTVGTSVDSGFAYRWQYQRPGGERWIDTTLTGYNTAELTVPAELGKNGYRYRCVLTGSKSSTIISEAAALHVGDPVVIVDQSVDSTVPAGRTVGIMVDATNVYSYQWQYQRPGGERWIDTTMEGADTATLQVQATSGRNGYKYRCVIKGLNGTEIISQPVTLTVK